MKRQTFWQKYDLLRKVKWNPGLNFGNPLVLADAVVLGSLYAQVSFSFSRCCVPDR
jgi:hypothetical protein